MEHFVEWFWWRSVAIGYRDFCHFVLYSSITFICTYAYAIYGCFLKWWFLIGFSFINHPFWGTPILGNPHMCSVLMNKDSLPVHLFWFAMVPAAGIESQLSTVGFISCHASSTSPWQLPREMEWFLTGCASSLHGLEVDSRVLPYIYRKKNSSSILPYASQVVQDGIPSSIQYMSQALETSEKPDMQSLQYAAEMH